MSMKIGDEAFQFLTVTGGGKSLTGQVKPDSILGQ
jgi:hypothetical protein